MKEYQVEVVEDVRLTYRVWVEASSSDKAKDKAAEKVIEGGESLYYEDSNGFECEILVERDENE